MVRDFLLKTRWKKVNGNGGTPPPLQPSVTKVSEPFPKRNKTYRFCKESSTVSGTVHGFATETHLQWCATKIQKIQQCEKNTQKYSSVQQKYRKIQQCDTKIQTNAAVWKKYRKIQQCAIKIQECAKNTDKYSSVQQKYNSVKKQARKPRSYASLKLRLTDLPTHLLTRVKSRATSVAKNHPHHHMSIQLWLIY